MSRLSGVADDVTNATATANPAMQKVMGVLLYAVPMTYALPRLSTLFVRL
jgi:hypothetical protein